MPGFRIWPSPAAVIFDRQRGDLLRFGRRRIDRRLFLWGRIGGRAGSNVVRSLLLRGRRFEPQHRQNGPCGFALLRKHRFGSGVPGWGAGKFFVGRAQQRRRAKPEDKYRDRQNDRDEQKPEAGQHGEANSACAGLPAKAFERRGTR